MRSLRPKIDDLHIFSRSTNPSIIALTESWLSDSISNDEIYITDYSEPLRHDRCNGKKGGGVCVYIHNGFAFSRCEFSDCPLSIECVSFIMKEPLICIIILYIPPSLRSAEMNLVSIFLQNCLRYFLEYYPSSHILVAGDFNNFPCNTMINDFGLYQLVNLPTRGSSTLDKIFVDPLLRTKYSAPISCPAFGSSDHLSILMKPLNSVWQVTHVKRVYDMRKSNIAKFTECLNNAPWHYIYDNSLSLADKCNMFYEFVNLAITVIPQTYVEMSSRDKAWMTPILKNLINLRYSAFRSGNMHLYEHYRDKVKLEISKAKHAWVMRSSRNSNSIWSIVREMCDLKSKPSVLFEAMIKGHETPTHAAEAFASSYYSHFSPESNAGDMNMHGIVNDYHWVPDSSPAVVFSKMVKLKSKAPGIDLLSAKLIRDAAHILCYPVAHLFSISISSGIVPSIWKTANVVPIPKNGKFDHLNFRPISLLPTISKILEDIVLKSVHTLLQKLSGDNQFAYKKNLSTLHAQIAVHEYVTSHLDDRDFRGVILISFDLKRAFDSLSHRSIVETLVEGGLPSNFIQWTISYLRDRHYRVSLQDIVYSALRPMPSGVPQGSVLAPQIFAAHMGSLKSKTRDSYMVKYADDVLVAIPIRSNTDIENTISLEEENIKLWCYLHGLTLNTQKTTCMFVRCGHPIPDTVRTFSSSMKFLGVFFNAMCNWDDHIDYVCRNASRRVYALRRLKSAGISRPDLIIVFCSYIRSLLEYNSPLFVGLSVKNDTRLQKIFRLCHRIICGNDCKNMCLGDVINRRVHRACKVFNEILQPSSVLHYLAPRQLEYSKHLELCHLRTHRRSSAFIPFCTVLHNSVLKR